MVLVLNRKHLIVETELVLVVVWFQVGSAFAAKA